MAETMSTRLARIEVQLQASQARSDERHDELKSMIIPVLERVEKHHILHVINGRDRKWMYGIAAFMGGAAGFLAKLLPHA